MKFQPQTGLGRYRLHLSNQYNNSSVVSPFSRPLMVWTVVMTLRYHLHLNNHGVIRFVLFRLFPRSLVRGSYGGVTRDTSLPPPPLLLLLVVGLSLSRSKICPLCFWKYHTFTLLCSSLFPLIQVYAHITPPPPPSSR